MTDLITAIHCRRRQHQSSRRHFPSMPTALRWWPRAPWFHEVVVPNAQTLLFPNGQTKFVRPEDGSIGKEPGTGVVLIGMGEVANAALERSGIGFFVRLRGTP